MSVHRGPDATRATAMAVTEHANSACLSEQGISRPLSPIATVHTLHAIADHAADALQLLAFLDEPDCDAEQLRDSIEGIKRQLRRIVGRAAIEPAPGVELSEVYAVPVDEKCMHCDQVKMHALRDPAQLALIPDAPVISPRWKDAFLSILDQRRAIEYGMCARFELTTAGRAVGNDEHQGAGISPPPTAHQAPSATMQQAEPLPAPGTPASAAQLRARRYLLDHEAL